MTPEHWMACKATLVLNAEATVALPDEAKN
jgi:hypothetical protein